MYVKKIPMRVRGRRRGLMGFGSLGDFTDDDQCSVIPAGDPYRKPGNYCATPDGGITTFNADGSTFRQPGAVDPDPAHSARGGASSGGGVLDTFLKTLFPTPTMATGPLAPMQTGIGTGTALMIAGGVVLFAFVATRRRS
jgi:hypothetical protein